MTAGDVVVLRFPFSDLSGSKVRPAVVLATVGRDDIVACQVTSNRLADARALELSAADFVAGGLKMASFVRPGKLFTAHRKIVSKRVARLKDAVRERIRQAAIEIIRQG